MNAESAYECATCADIFEDFEDAANCCGYGYYDIFTCGACATSYFTEYEAERCCREQMSHEDQIYALRTAEFAADGEECVRRDDAARIARAADAEIAALRAENERLDRLTEKIARL